LVGQSEPVTQAFPEKKSPAVGPRQLAAGPQMYELDELTTQQTLVVRLHDTSEKPRQSMVGPMQLPAPSQNKVVSVPTFGPLGPGLVPQNVLAALGEHVPVPQPLLQLPVHAVLQQMDPTQKAVLQSPFAPHAAPCARLKLAVTLVAPVTVTLQGELPVGVQPTHPVKTPLLAAVAESETLVP
jgi:hypothetical protein